MQLRHDEVKIQVNILSQFKVTAG